MSTKTARATTLSGEINLRKDRVDAAKTIERRVKPRLHERFPATVKGTDTAGQAFELPAELGNLSSSGLYLRMPRSVDVGKELKVLICFSNGVSTGAKASVLGRVLRVDRSADGFNGFGLAIMNYEFV